MMLFGSSHAVDVTFRVDMSNVPAISANGVHITGTINFWDPAADSLTHIGNDVYEITLALSTNLVHEYKFVNGNTMDDTEGVYGDCAFATYRFLTVPGVDTVLPTVCFGYCDSACTPVSGTRIACIGNSITAGFGAADRFTQAYTEQLQNLLGSSYLVGNHGAPGATMIRFSGNPFVLREQYHLALEFAPEKAVIQLGTNDSKAPVWDPWDSLFVPHYRDFLALLDSLPSAPELYVTLPTKAFTSAFGIRDSVIQHAIIPAIEALARTDCHNQIDLYTPMIGLDSLFPDGIHPDSAGHARIAARIHAVLTQPVPTFVQTANFLTATGGYAWQWYRDGDTIPAAQGGTAQALPLNQSGTYKLRMRTHPTFSDWRVSDSLAMLFVGNESAGASDLRYWPQPVRSILTVAPPPELSGGHWQVRDLQGKLLSEGRVPDVPGAVFRISTSGLAAGTYLLSMQADHRRQVGRFVVK